MFVFRSVLLGVALAIAGITNLFFAPQIQSPRPPVFDASDMVAIEKWEDQGYRFHPVWLSKNLPQSSFTHVRIGRPHGAEQGGNDVGILWNAQIVGWAGLSVDETNFPLDISGLNIRNQIEKYFQLSGTTRCRPHPDARGIGRCNYFVAWDDETPSTTPQIFVAVFTVTDQKINEAGFIERGLLERLAPIAIEDLRTIGDLAQ
jgi:hypothetical protein